MTALSSNLWNKAIAEQLTHFNALVDIIRDLTPASPLPHRKYDPYRKERALLKRINRCRTENGKLKALQRALEDERDY